MLNFCAKHHNRVIEKENSVCYCCKGPAYHKHSANMLHSKYPRKQNGSNSCNFNAA